MTSAQRRKIHSLIARHGTKIDDCDIIEYRTDQNIAGLPAGWVSVTIPTPSGNMYSFGISPEGQAHS